MIIASEPAAI